MTLLTTPEMICVGDVGYEVQEIIPTAEVVRTAELTGQLVIAQQVDVAGNPFTIVEPCKDRSGMSLEVWNAYVQHIADIQKKLEVYPRITMPPYIGTLRFLGATASYCALDKLHSNTTALLALQPMPAIRDRPAYGFRLYRVE